MWAVVGVVGGLLCVGLVVFLLARGSSSSRPAVAASAVAQAASVPQSLSNAAAPPGVVEKPLAVAPTTFPIVEPAASALNGVQASSATVAQGAHAPPKALATFSSKKLGRTSLAP